MNNLDDFSDTTAKMHLGVYQFIGYYLHEGLFHLYNYCAVEIQQNELERIQEITEWSFYFVESKQIVY